jgi:predicted esterase
MAEQPLDFIHRFIPASKPDLSALLLLHGTGGNENDLIELGRDLLPGAALLSPRGKVLENGMPRFFRRSSEGVFDLDDLQFRARELGDFVESARKQYRIESSPLISVGYSNGANIGSALIFARPDLLAGCCLFRPMVPYIPEPLPDLSRKKICILSGSQDRTISPDQPAKLKSLFEQCRATVLLHQSNAGHELTTQDIRVAQARLANF